jgi:hypothetical protein
MNKGKKFVGQTVLSQTLAYISSSIIISTTRKHQSNRYYKRIPARVHLISLLGCLAIVMGLENYAKE